jgi:hypothetical protein
MPNITSNIPILSFKRKLNPYNTTNDENYIWDLYENKIKTEFYIYESLDNRDDITYRYCLYFLSPIIKINYELRHFDNITDAKSTLVNYYVLAYLKTHDV